MQIRSALSRMSLADILERPVAFDLFSSRPMVAKWFSNSFESSVGLVIDTPFTFRDVTAVFPDLSKVRSLIGCRVFLCLRADVSYFLCPFSACNKGNRRRLHAGKVFLESPVYSFKTVLIIYACLGNLILEHTILRSFLNCVKSLESLHVLGSIAPAGISLRRGNPEEAL